jgi:hypothetical protein
MITPHEQMTDWHKSTYTHWEENACVEVGSGPGMVGIRDTKQRELPNEVRPILVVPASSFTALLDHLAA